MDAAALAISGLTCESLRSRVQGQGCKAPQTQLQWLNMAHCDLHRQDSLLRMWQLGLVANLGLSAVQAMHVGMFDAVLVILHWHKPAWRCRLNAAGDIVWLLCTGSRAVQLLQKASECLTCYDDLIVSAVWSACCPLPAHMPCGLRAYIIIAVAMQHVCCSCCGLVVSWDALCTLLPLLPAQFHLILVSRGCVLSLKSGVGYACRRRRTEAL